LLDAIAEPKLKSSLVTGAQDVLKVAVVAVARLRGVHTCVMDEPTRLYGMYGDQCVNVAPILDARAI
jgi:hypothetical protein